MVYRITLQVLEWLAVSAATGLCVLAYLDASAGSILALALALIGANAVRGISLSAAAGAQIDGVLRRLHSVSSGSAGEGGAR